LLLETKHHRSKNKKNKKKNFCDRSAPELVGRNRCVVLLTRARMHERARAHTHKETHTNMRMQTLTHTYARMLAQTVYNDAAEDLGLGFSFILTMVWVDCLQ
jgi:hypothetical protein